MKIINLIWPTCNHCNGRIIRPFQCLARWPEGDVFHVRCEKYIYDNEDTFYKDET